MCSIDNSRIGGSIAVRHWALMILLATLVGVSGGCRAGGGCADGSCGPPSAHGFSNGSGTR